jgi:hypothetical protein
MRAEASGAGAIPTDLRGIAANPGQFGLKMLQVFFVGSAIGMERAVWRPLRVAKRTIMTGQAPFLAQIEA